MDHHRKLERMYATAPVNALYGHPVLRVDEGTASLSFEVGPQHHHAARGMHGSVYFKALDDAAWFAVASLVEDVFVLTATFEVELLRPFGVGTVRAVGRVTARGERFEAEAELVDEAGRVLGRGRGQFARARSPLGPDVGYA